MTLTPLNLHSHIHTRDQHGGNYFSILQHVYDAALEIFTAVGLQVATDTENKKKSKNGEKSETLI